MTTTEQEFADYMVAREKENEAAERPFLVRTFAAEISPGDGRTVDVRVVPYGEEIVHDDGHGGVPRGVPYKEVFVRGAFSHQVTAANRVLLNFEHQDGIAGVVGHGKALLDREDGFYGSFKIHETPDGDKALMLVNEGVLSTVSMEAAAQKSVRTKDGVVQRVKAHLRNVALTRFGAYQGAVVLAVREEVVFDEEMLPVEPDPEMIERCRRLGIRLPQRYQAHPDESDTPAETGTPEDGTRQDTKTPTSEE